MLIRVIPSLLYNPFRLFKASHLEWRNEEMKKSCDDSQQLFCCDKNMYPLHSYLFGYYVALHSSLEASILACYSYIMNVV